MFIFALGVHVVFGTMFRESTDKYCNVNKISTILLWRQYKTVTFPKLIIETTKLIYDLERLYDIVFLYNTASELWCCFFLLKIKHWSNVCLCLSSFVHCSIHRVIIYDLSWRHFEHTVPVLATGAHTAAYGPS